ncbi:hypothetical protein ACFL7M_13005 [Thermodesulfobacteriota bacterium]
MELDHVIKVPEQVAEWGEVVAAAEGGGFAAGPGGYCVCPNCVEKFSQQLGTPCYEQRCPKCGTAMIRE